MKRLRKWLATVASFLILVLVIVGFSVYNARRACDKILRNEFDPPRPYSTRFVLYPTHHMEGAEDLGFKPGWIITYANSTRRFGTAFYVTFFGKLRARGTPNFVVRNRAQDQIDMDRFVKAFAEADAAVQVGNSFSNVVALLGSDFVAHTNDNGSVSIDYFFMPRSLAPAKWLTNGFALTFSNGILVRKDHSYMGR